MWGLVWTVWLGWGQHVHLPFRWRQVNRLAACEAVLPWMPRKACGKILQLDADRCRSGKNLRLDVDRWRPGNMVSKILTLLLALKRAGSK